MRTSPPLPVVLSLTALIEGLFEAVCARYGVFPIRGPLVRFLWKRLFRIQRHFAALAARFVAGADLSPRPARRRGARRARDDNSFRITRWVSPKFGWLCRIASGSVGAWAFGWALRHLLTTDPEMLALLAATPATARILRPLCWMLGVAAPTPPMAVVPCADATGEVEARAPETPRAVARTRTVPAPPVSTPPDPPEIFCPVAVLRAA